MGLWRPGRLSRMCSHVRAPAVNSAPVRADIARKNARPSGDWLLVVHR
ncbi:hypothetical protein [Streptomyces sp. OE57]